MKALMEMVVYSDDGKSCFRKSWSLPDIAADDFNPEIHMAKVFSFPENTPTYGSVYIWKHASPESKEEEKKLIELGKWGGVSSKHDI